MKLRRNEYCPIHRSRVCCGRERVQRDGRSVGLLSCQAESRGLGTVWCAGSVLLSADNIGSDSINLEPAVNSDVTPYKMLRPFGDLAVFLT